VRADRLHNLVLLTSKEVNDNREYGVTQRHEIILSFASNYFIKVKVILPFVRFTTSNLYKSMSNTSIRQIYNFQFVQEHDEQIVREGQKLNCTMDSK
jgi:hypothetical protein